MGKRKVRVMMVGSARESGGGIATVIKTMTQMTIWDEFDCYWLGTQIQRNYVWKVWYALKAYFIALFIIWRYDIIHFHTVPNISMKIQLPIFLLARIGKKKIILHLHVGNQLSMDEYVNEKLAHWCMNRADILVLLSYKCETYIDDFWSDVKSPRSVIYNACNEVNFVPYEQHFKKILFVGRFTKNKSADILIRAFSRIHEKYSDWSVRILAEGPEMEKCRELARNLGVENKVEMPGFLYGVEKDKSYQEAGIFCLCSFYEGFPMVVLDSWAHGVPVVTTPVGGVTDVMEEGKNGFTYEFGNVDRLAEKLDILMGNENLRKEMSLYCRSFVQEKFSIETINTQWRQLYYNLVER